MLKIPQTQTHTNPSKCLLLLYQLAPPAERRSADVRSTTSSSHLLRWYEASPFAGVNLFSLRALLAFDVAAPTHLALAGSGHLPALSVVTSPAANGVAVFVLVALTGRCAWRILAGPAETWRILYVEQVHSARDLVVQARQGLQLLLLLLRASACGDLPLPRGLISGASHLDRRLVTLLQLLADFVEWQELPPARLDGARARDAVAFARGLHSGLDYLDQRHEMLLS